MSKRFTTEEFIEKAKKIHGDNYDYSKVNYVNQHIKVCIICPIHGEFWQIPQSHLRGMGCEKCKGKKISFSKRSTLKDFVYKAKKIHGDRYDYSKVNYKNGYTKVCIICPVHGEFWQRPNSHLYGNGCPKCANNIKLDRQIFIERAKEIHKNKYLYEKVEYNGYDSKVCIICPKHGEFWQEASNHLQGKGCPKCKETVLEKYMRNILEENKIEYIYQKRFPWLGKQSLDFYLPKYNIAIECQGKQHYEPVDFAGKGKDWAEKLFEENKKRDKTKFKKIKMHNIKMMYVNEENKNNFLKALKNEII